MTTLAKPLGVAVAVADQRAAIAHANVEAVVVSTPGHLHESVVLDAFAAGKHVLCETFADELSDFLELIAGCATRIANGGSRVCLGS